MSNQTKPSLGGKIFSFGAAAAAFLFAPIVALAQVGGSFQSGLSGIGGLFPQSGIAGSTQLTGTNGLIYNVIQMMLLVAGAVAVLFVIVGGFWYLTSAGNEEQAEKGKTAVVNAIIGIIIIVLSYVVINVIANFVASNGTY